MKIYCSDNSTRELIDRYLGRDIWVEAYLPENSRILDSTEYLYYIRFIGMSDNKYIVNRVKASLLLKDDLGINYTQEEINDCITNQYKFRINDIEIYLTTNTMTTAEVSQILQNKSLIRRGESARFLDKFVGKNVWVKMAHPNMSDFYGKILSDMGDCYYLDTISWLVVEGHAHYQSGYRYSYHLRKDAVMMCLPVEIIDNEDLSISIGVGL